MQQARWRLMVDEQGGQLLDQPLAAGDQAAVVAVLLGQSKLRQQTPAGEEERPGRVRRIALWRAADVVVALPAILRSANAVQFGQCPPGGGARAALAQGVQVQVFEHQPGVAATDAMPDDARHAQAPSTPPERSVRRLRRRTCRPDRRR
jgi:hypothetical protein